MVSNYWIPVVISVLGFGHKLADKMHLIQCVSEPGFGSVIDLGFSNWLHIKITWKIFKNIPMPSMLTPDSGQWDF